MKTLYFEGAGCFNVNEYLDPEFRGNPRIRTAFRNDKGAAIYLELICGANYYFKNLFVDACYYIKGDDDCNKHRLGIDRHGAATMYTTNGILCLLNKIGATFDAIEVLPSLSGYKVFSDRPTNNRMASDRPVAGYNFGDEFVPDWDEIHKREMVYELLCPELYFIQEISSNGWRIDARYKETVPNVIKRLCDTISLPTAHFYSTYAEAQRELDDELAEYQRQANLSDYEWALEDLNKVLAHWAKLYGHTEDECENIRRRLLTLKKFEELEFCLMSSNVGYKYFKSSKWNAIYPVPNYKGELVYDNMSM